MRLLARKGRARGFIEIEVVMSVAILTVVTILAAEGIFSYYRAHRQQVARQAAAWAADAQLQRYQAGAPIDSAPPAGMIPEEIVLTTRVQPGKGPWQGFNLVTVTATTAISPSGEVREEISGYLRPQVLRTEGEP